MQWFETTEGTAFHEKKDFKLKSSPADNILKRDTAAQTEQSPEWTGFGSCFNELGYISMQDVSKKDRDGIFENLYTNKGLGLTWGRIPIGASDYAEKWYTLDDEDDDWDLKYFSIERDKKYLLPYIKEAQLYCPGMTFLASPWSPPVWMKSPSVYNYGRIKTDERTLSTYSRYLEKFIQAYEETGIHISQLHIQNEPFADQKFPSCLWYPEVFQDFIKNYLGPLFQQDKINTNIFLGTLNGPEEMKLTGHKIEIDNYDPYINTILFDKDVRKYVKGLGFQWAGRNTIERAHDCFPEMELMQTENECGDGTNDWEYARYCFNLIRHYMTHGAKAYCYWNAVLKVQGESSWGWTQNSLISINPKTNEVIYNPEYYVFLHYSHFIRPGAVRIPTRGQWNSAAVLYKNADGKEILVIQNAMKRAEDFTFEDGSRSFTVTLQPQSFNTFVL